MGQTVPNICKGGHPLTPLCLHGGRRLNQNRTFHINTIKNQCQQSEEEWHLTPTPVWHMPYSGYISILLLRPPPLPTLTDMYPAGQRWRHRVTNCTILVNEQNTEAVLGFVFTVVSSLPSSFLSLFFSSLLPVWFHSDINQMDDERVPIGHPWEATQEGRSSKAQTEPWHKHTQTDFDIQIWPCVTQTLP